MKKFKILLCLSAILLAGLLMCAVANAANQPGKMISQSSLQTATVSAPSQAVTDAMGTANMASPVASDSAIKRVNNSARCPATWSPGSEASASSLAKVNTYKVTAPEAISYNSISPKSDDYNLAAKWMPTSKTRASAAPADNGLTLACRGAPRNNSAQALKVT